MKRPRIPRELQRQVLLEAGHRCAIPTCRHPTVDMAHIKPWAKVRTHAFGNLIALCPTCHRRHHRGEIDSKALRQYKANLVLLNSRYSDLERRVLEYFADRRDQKDIWLPGGLNLLLMYLIEDGFLNDTGENNGAILGGIPIAERYELTTKGRAFVRNWVSAKKLG